MASTGQQVLVTLRKMIADGQLAAGQRLVEIPTAESLGVSRMPVRMAFRALEQEGFLIKNGRGYTIRAITAAEIAGAVEVRGVLEGLAILQAVEQGDCQTLLQTLRQCLHDGDALFGHGHLTEEDFERYQDMNCRFHEAIVEASGNPAVADALSRNNHLPFASVTALAVDPAQPDREYLRFYYAHLQHHAIVDAISRGQGARAEALMREHANATLKYVDAWELNDVAQRAGQAAEPKPAEPKPAGES
jgi:GntR family transcriptional regulator, vanillate catabolism transcriptional regulator